MVGRGVPMQRRRALLAVGGLVVLLLAVYVPATAVLDPSASPILVVGGSRSPTSTVAPLAEFSRQVVTINYTSDGTAGLSGVFWTELWYQTPGQPWKMYTPPWNPSGQWAGAPLNSPMYESVGTILFDTFYTGGEAAYNFTTVAVDRGFYRESGQPPQDMTAHGKAKTMVDLSPPVLFVAKPSPGSWTNSNELQYVAMDRVSGVASVLVSVDGGPATTYQDAAGTVPLSLTTQGAHNLMITATDRAGNSLSVPDPFNYDSVAPSLEITSPEANSYVNTADVDVTWTSEPSTTGAPIASLLLSVDSNAPVTLSGDATSYSLSSLTESGHVVSLLAQDAAGNIATQTVSFGIDRTAPSVTIVSPATGSYVNTQRLQAVWSGSDSGSGIKEYLVSIDGQAPQTVVNAAGYQFPSVTEAIHTVTVQAFDRAGNSAKATSTVTVDATPPTVSVDSPGPGATVYGTASVNWTATDSGSGIGQVFVVVDGLATSVDVASVGQSVSPLSIGIHTATVRVYDRAGNMAEATVPFTYGGPTPPGQGPAGLPALDFWLIMVVIGAAAIASAYYAVRRRRRAKA